MAWWAACPRNAAPAPAAAAHLVAAPRLHRHRELRVGRHGGLKVHNVPRQPPRVGHREGVRVHIQHLAAGEAKQAGVPAGAREAVRTLCLAGVVQCPFPCVPGLGPVPAALCTLPAPSQCVRARGSASPAPAPRHALATPAVDLHSQELGQHRRRHNGVPLGRHAAAVCPWAGPPRQRRRGAWSRAALAQRRPAERGGGATQRKEK